MRIARKMLVKKDLLSIWDEILPQRYKTDRNYKETILNRLTCYSCEKIDQQNIRWSKEKTMEIEYHVK